MARMAVVVTAVGWTGCAMRARMATWNRFTRLLDIPNACIAFRAARPTRARVTVLFSLTLAASLSRSARCFGGLSIRMKISCIELSSSALGTSKEPGASLPDFGLHAAPYALASVYTHSEHLLQPRPRHTALHDQHADSVLPTLEPRDRRDR